MQPTQDFDFFSTHFWQKVAISGSDISLANAELSTRALGPWLGVLFWLMLLLVPLSGIQRVGRVTGESYVLFLVASASLLCVMFCIPWVGRDLSPQAIAILLGAAALGAWRWHQGSSTSRLATSILNQEKGPTP